MPETNAVRYRAKLAYDGTAYQGFQRQRAGSRTIQGMIEKAIAKVTQQSVNVMGAGRTDAGVHATGQVIAFDVVWGQDDSSLLRAINARLPDDIALQDIRRQPKFHPRFHALSRTYHYLVIHADQPQPLIRDRTWRVYNQLDVDLLHKSAKMLIGKHDFASFGQPPQGNNTVREVFKSEWSVEQRDYGQLLTYEIQATAFLYHMVRRIVGTLVRIGRGNLTIAQFEEIFASCDLTRLKLLAPPQGLTLVQVDYKD